MLVDCTESDAGDWASRNDHWRLFTQQTTKPRGRRQRLTEPLVLCGHGVSLRVDGAALLIRNGRTHHPHDPEAYRFFKGDLALPPRIITIDGSGSISFDVLDWLGEQQIPLVRLNWNGEVLSYPSVAMAMPADREKVAWQEATRRDPKQRLTFSTELVRKKIAASVATLGNSIPPSPARRVALEKAHAAIEQLFARQPHD